MNIKPFFGILQKPLLMSDLYFLSKFKRCTSKHISQSVGTVSLAEIKKVLKNNNISFIDGFTSVKIQECTFCAPLKKRVSSSKPNEIYVNKKTGYFLCERCKHTGPWNILENLITASKTEERTLKELAILKDGSSPYDKYSSNWKQTVASLTPLMEFDEVELNSILDKFTLPIVPKSVIEKLQVYTDTTKSVLYFPLLSSGTVVGIKTLNTDKLSTTTPKQNSSGYLLVTGSKKKSDSVVIVPNIHDLFALASQNLPYHFMCLPHSTSNLPQSLLPFLESYEKVIIWFGTEIGSDGAAKSFAKKLNDKRCFIIKTENRSSVFSALLKGESIKCILNSAKPTWHQAITTFSSLREDVLIELQNNDTVQGIKWTRFPVLNKILKGHRRGELTVLTGPTGSGKTTFMSEYSLDLATQGVNTLWGSFEIRNARLARTMLQQLAEIPLEDNLDVFDKWADQFENLPIYFMTFHGQQSTKTVMDAVEHASYIHDIAHVVIDNLQFMMGVSQDVKFLDRFWIQDSIIQLFRTFATKNNCHVTLVIHPRKEKESEDLTTSSIFGGAKASQEADNILIIQDKRLTNVRGKKFLQVAKNRYTGDLGIVPLEFDKPSLSFSVRKKKSASNENEILGS